MANKITKKEVIRMMLAEEIVKGNATYVAYLENELELLEKKSANKKATKTQEENVGIKDTIAEVLATISQGTVTDIMNANAELKAFSNQKISALIKQMIDAGLVTKTVDKKKSYFSLVETDEPQYLDKEIAF